MTGLMIWSCLCLIRPESDVLRRVVTASEVRRYTINITLLKEGKLAYRIAGKWRLTFTPNQKETEVKDRIEGTIRRISEEYDVPFTSSKTYRENEIGLPVKFGPGLSRQDVRELRIGSILLSGSPRSIGESWTETIEATAKDEHPKIVAKYRWTTSTGQGADRSARIEVDQQEEGVKDPIRMRGTVLIRMLDKLPTQYDLVTTGLVMGDGPVEMRFTARLDP